MESKIEQLEWIKELESYQIIGMIEESLTHRRLSRSGVIGSLKELFQINGIDIAVTEIQKGEDGIDDYFDIYFNDEELENDIYTIFALKTNEKDKYYITEIG